jgi:uncharacterized protein YprB with RNaseH-like and TPR domain
VKPSPEEVTVLFASARDLKILENVEKPIQKAWDSDLLRVVAFSDYRVQDISLLLEFVKNSQPPPHLLLYAGDDVERFQNDLGNLFEQLAATATHGLCAVVGNDSETENADVENDKPARIRLLDEVTAAYGYVRGKGVYNVHRTPVVIGSYAVIGSEGSPPDEELGALGTIVYPEASIARHLHTASKAVKGKHTIVVSHAPPRGVLDLAIRFGTRHIGSVALKQFLLRQRNVPLVVCGHVHNCGAQSKTLGRSVVVNAASHDDPGAPGRVALIELRAGKVFDVRWHLLWELCSVAGIKAKRESRLSSAGIHNIDELAKASEARIAKAIECGESEASRLRDRASALSKQEVVLRGKLQLPTTNRVYLDIETDVGGKFIWLVGIHAQDEGKSYALYADTPQDERQILSDMLRFIAMRGEINLISCSGSRFEQRLLTQRLSAHGLPTEVAQSIRDIYFDIHGCAAFPIQTLTLKDVAKWCGFKWRTSLDGFDAALTYGSAGNLPKATKRLLIRYNEDDLLAVKHVVQHLENLGQRRAHAAQV